jgi:hypothetical protein
VRVDLPKPDCASRPSDCADIAVLNKLDGFNIQPRISIPFSGPLDLSTVSSSTIFLVGPEDHVVGINQIEWEPLTNTLHAESNEQLAQHSTYLLVVTRGVHDSQGRPIDAMTFGQTAYDKALRRALPMAEVGGATRSGIADASVFTTQSIDSISKKIRKQLHASTPTFALGPGGARTVFPMSSVAAIQWTRQTGTSSYSPPSFLPTPAIVGVGTIAFGSYASPDYETAAKIIPPYGTATDVPVAQGSNQVQFTLFIPAGVKPKGGWPVAIFGHGFTDSKNGAPWAVAGTLARAGIASIAINVVGHGGGADGTYTVLRTTDAPVVFRAGGRGIDQDGNGTIDSTEGVSAIGAQALIGNRDGLRQTTIDLMQLVKVLKAGVNVDGTTAAGGHSDDGKDGGDDDDGNDDENGNRAADLSTSRIYYVGQSFGGIYGTQLLGLERDIRAGVPNVPGGPIIEIARLSPSFRPLVGIALITRTPSLYNAAPNASFTSFVENMPLRNLPTVTDTVPGASAIQESIDRTEWAQQAANPAAYAPYITRPVLYQFARGDKTVPNPTTAAILRACGCAARATLFRNDLAYALNPLVGKNPHTFLTNIVGAGAGYALLAQEQIAEFFASNGATTIDPDGAGPFFETPASMVPEDLAYIP